MKKRVKIEDLVVGEFYIEEYIDKSSSDLYGTSVIYQFEGMGDWGAKMRVISDSDKSGTAYAAGRVLFYDEDDFKSPYTIVYKL